MSHGESMTRRKLIVAVWKEKLTYHQSRVAAKQIAEGVRNRPWPFSVAIAPNPFSYVAVREELWSSGVEMAAQNLLWDTESGSYIGEVTASMLEEVGCEYVILGHSERRLHFSESDDMIAWKVLTAVRHGIVPIICFGDTVEQKKNGETKEVIRHQLGACFDRLGGLLSPSRVMLAYEPVWAISTWRSEHALPPGEEVSHLHGYIREIVAQMAGPEFAMEVSLLYGGSVSSDNANDYLSFNDVDGALVGGASKTPESFLATLHEAAGALTES